MLQAEACQGSIGPSAHSSPFSRSVSTPSGTTPLGEFGSISEPTMSYHSDPVAQSGQRNTRRPRVMIAGFFLHLVHWKVNTGLGLLAYRGCTVYIGPGTVFLKLDFGCLAGISRFATLAADAQ